MRDIGDIGETRGAVPVTFASVLFAALWLTATTRLIKPYEDDRRAAHEHSGGRTRRMLSMRRRETAATTR